MSPEEIIKHFGKDALTQLRGVILDRSVNEIADWVLMYHDEKQIANWLIELRQDDEE